MTDSSISDITVQILRDIREDIRGVKSEVRGTNQRLDALTGEVHELTRQVHATNERLDVTNERLTLVEHTVNEAASLIRSVGAIVVNKHEKAIDNLRKRVARLEAKAGGGT